MFYGIFLFFVLFGWLTWAGRTLNQLPRDISNLKISYEEKNWPDFWSEIATLTISWLFVLVPLVFIIPLGKQMIQGFESIWEMVQGFRI